MGSGTFIILYCINIFLCLNKNVQKLRARRECREYQNNLEGCKRTKEQILKSYQKEVEHTLKIY